MTLQALENLRQPIVTHTVDEIEIDPRILERTAKAHDQRELLGREVVSIVDQRRGQIICRGVAKIRIRHRLLGEALQDIDPNRTFLCRTHVSIVLGRKWYGLN